MTSFIDSILIYFRPVLLLRAKWTLIRYLVFIIINIKVVLSTIVVQVMVIFSPKVQYWMLWKCWRFSQKLYRIAWITEINENSSLLEGSVPGIRKVNKTNCRAKVEGLSQSEVLAEFGWSPVWARFWDVENSIILSK